MQISSEFKLGVAIPAYQDVDGLRRCLHSIAGASTALAAQIVVADDSGDGRVAAALRNEFPYVNWIVHSRNLGFGRSANDAIANCAADIVILLNDDTEMVSDPIPPLSAIFTEADVFAVTFQSHHADGRFREGAKRLVWPMGFPRIRHNPEDQLPTRHGLQPSAYAVGGHAAYHRRRFLELGGFDPLFEPFYWEDVDLCERARRRSWQTYYLPDCIVNHDGRSAIRTAYQTSFIREMTLRNRLLFAWRHLPPALRLLHALSLGFQLALSWPTRQRTFWYAYHAAQKRLRDYHSPERLRHITQD
jgi:GT2 family glycosyltransferase